MSKYVAAAFLIAIAIEPAMALEAGVGAQAGNVGIGTSVGVGQKGASIGIGAGVGSVGGADVGASVGTGNGSVGASVGVGGQLSGEGASSESSTAGAPPGDTPGQPAAASGSNSVAAGVPQSIVLPRILRPYGGSGRSSAVTAIEAIPGTPSAVVRACREAIELAAIPFGVVSVRATSAGSLRLLSRGAVSAPIAVRIHYTRQGGAEIRQARIRCRLDATGRVIGLT
jgi:hypothetical protein